MPLTYQQVINEGILDALATVYRDPTNASVLLTSIGFPEARQPTFPVDGEASMTFWSRVCQLIANGVLVGGFEVLVATAARNYPGHPVLGRFRPPEPGAPPQVAENAAQPPQPSDVSIIVTGWADVQRLLDRARLVATELRIPPESVNLGFANMEGVLLTLANWQPEQALHLADRLRVPQNGHTVQTTVATSQFRDYLISQLFVEGPDQARFEINDIRASTPVRDVAQGVIATQYDPKVFQGTGGNRRQVVVDRVNDNGSTERLDPNQSLHDQNIRDGETLHVSPEATAGAVHPFVREEALARARGQVIEYAKSHPNFKVSANAIHAPTEYIFDFRVPGFASPPTPGERPIPIDDHQVFLVLPADFPMKAPEAFWQTDIFHPNVHPKNGKVCLGALGENYRPGLHFGELCQLLVDIAGYQNYALRGYNPDASKWAMTEDGQQAIMRIGGRSVSERYFQELQEEFGIEYVQKLLQELGIEVDLTVESAPRPLRIRRV
jgi:hypothetical protein